MTEEPWSWEWALNVRGPYGRELLEAMVNAELHKALDIYVHSMEAPEVKDREIRHHIGMAAMIGSHIERVPGGAG